MGTLQTFDSVTCPRCRSTKLCQLGDIHYLSLPVLTSDQKESTKLELYVKVCKRCGYVEYFAKSLIDKFQEVASRTGFGNITKKGQDYQLSIFVDYSHSDEDFSEFIIPISKEELEALPKIVNHLSDSQLLSLVFTPKHYARWKEQVGGFTDDFPHQLREFLAQWDPDECE